MSKQSIRKPLSIAIGAALVSGLGAAGIANAAQTDDNLFSMQELTSGYLLAGAHETSKDGEGTCGDDKKKEGEGKCGEGKCGDDKKEGGA
jgi:uncharacterized low-complexity protein